MEILALREEDSAVLDLASIRVDGGTQPRAWLNEDTWRDYADDMDAGAPFPPVTVYHDGSTYWLADGFHRVKAAESIGLTEIAADVRQGSKRDAILHSVAANADHGLRRTPADKRRAVETLLRDSEGWVDDDGQRHYWHEWSDREIGRRASVDHKFVSKVRIKVSGDIPRYGAPTERKVERNGTTYTQDTSRIGRRSALDDDEPEGLEPPSTDRMERPHVANNSGDNEWYTPRSYIDAAREVMGDIDLDPASHADANELIGAATFYSEQDDGLDQRWRGRVWMNPPYAQPLCSQFSEKLAESVQSGAVSEAVVLVNNSTETRWFQGMCAEAIAICFPLGRVKFWHPRKESVPLQGQAIIYFGENSRRFIEVFKQFGMAVYVTD